MKITENTARYTAQKGDAYELTVGSKKSTGTVDNATAAGVLTLKPSNAPTATFSVTVSGGSITAMEGTITFTDGKSEEAPTSTFTPGGNSGGGSSIPNGTISGNIAAADNAAPGVTNFGYWWDGTPLSDWIPGSSVTISGGTVNIKLGTPPDNEMASFAEIAEEQGWMEEDFTANPSTAKVYEEYLGGTFFYSSDGKYALTYAKGFDNIAVFWYVDKDVTVTGEVIVTTGTGGTYTWIFNCSLKKGWNYVFASLSGTTVNYTTGDTSGYKWQVFNWDDFPR